jgi:hypothetical protein
LKGDDALDRLLEEEPQAAKEKPGGMHIQGLRPASGSPFRKI